MKVRMRAKNRENLLWPLVLQGWVTNVPFLKVARRRNNIMGEPLLPGGLQELLVESIGLRLISESCVIKVGRRSG